MADHVTAAKKAIIARFRDVAQRYHRNLEQIAAHHQQVALLQTETALIQAEANDCHAAARLFGFDVIAAMAAEDTIAKTIVESVPPPKLESAPAPRMSRGAIREFVLREGEQAYPKPIRATELRKKLQDQSYKFHEKTIGMTLYRLLQRGIFRREHIDWFFIPEGQRQQPPSEDENPGAETPGLFTTH